MNKPRLSKSLKILLVLFVGGGVLMGANALFNALMFPTAYGPLFFAAQDGNVDRVKKYLHNGYDPNVCCWTDGSLLQTAQKYKQWEVVKILKDAGARE